MIIDEPGPYITRDGSVVIIRGSETKTDTLILWAGWFATDSNRHYFYWENNGKVWSFGNTNIVSKAYLTDFEKELWNLNDNR